MYNGDFYTAILNPIKYKITKLWDPSWSAFTKKLILCQNLSFCVNIVENILFYFLKPIFFSLQVLRNIEVKAGISSAHKLISSVDSNDIQQQSSVKYRSRSVPSRRWRLFDRQFQTYTKLALLRHCSKGWSKVNLILALFSFAFFFTLICVLTELITICAKQSTAIIQIGK